MVAKQKLVSGNLTIGRHGHRLQSTIHRYNITII